MEKHLLMRVVARLVEGVGGDAIIDVGESWLHQVKENSRLASLNMREDFKRDEVLNVTLATRDGILRTYVTPFTRGTFGGIQVGRY